MPTAVIELYKGTGSKGKARALLDACSESTFVSTRIARRFGTRLVKSSIGVVGVTGEVLGSSIARTQLEIYVPESDQRLQVQAHVLRNIGLTTPPQLSSVDVQSLFNGLKLADPELTTPREVDVIIGSNVYANVLLSGVIRRNEFVAQRTIFGWVITGSQEGPFPHLTRTFVVQQETDQQSWHEQLIELLQRFWSVEEIPHVVRTSADSTACEVCYKQGYSRDLSGRYIVPLPVKQDCLALLGGSLTQARRALTAAHRRMKLDPELRKGYIEFMDDYIRQGHMRLVSDDDHETPASRINYLPHHAVWQRSDGGRRLRVVFNASCPTSTGYSLNDILHSGPKLQNDLLGVVTRWRMHKVASCADIKMMFRQISVRQGDRDLQRIVWSRDDQEPEAHYVLLTVTYGETSSPYLALRTLRQLCEDEGSLLPEAVEAIHRDLYVDDFLSGAEDKESARRRRDQIIQLLKAGGFNLKKWVSNTPNLLSDLPAEDRLRPSWLHFTTDGPVNELGIAWDPSDDCFRFAAPEFNDARAMTKRRVLAETARLFDPAGWLAPVVVTAKMFIQDLWRAKLGWDEHLPLLTARRWESFRASLSDISSFKIRRWLRITSDSELQLHAFADASRRALAATVYARAIGGTDHITTSLICAKTNLAPIRTLISSKRPTTRMTVPRLELRAALLAARLLQSVASSLNIQPDKCQLWSDSTITLHWLKSTDPVGNDLVDGYIHQIQEILPHGLWRYVPSSENPADIATRGTEPSSLEQDLLWWTGPSWLAESQSSWPAAPPSGNRTGKLDRFAEDLSAWTCLATSRADSPFVDRFSNLTRLLKAVVRCRRWACYQRNRNSAKPLAPMTAGELSYAFLACFLATEISDLSKGRPVKTTSVLSRVDPFLDDDGILRVGGRLRHSLLPYEEKHPPILSGSCHLAQLLIEWAHQRALHGCYDQHTPTLYDERGLFKESDGSNAASATA